MLGNFSFGDYFKEQAIPYAWELVTKDFGLPQGPAAGHACSPRTTTRPRSGRRSPACRTNASSASRPTDNFWRMGDTGPCGPCSEIFYDHGPRCRAARPARRMKTATGSSRSGTWCSCSSRKARPARACACRGPRSTPAWGWSASPRSCRASTTTTTPTSFRALILASAEATGQDPDGPFRVSHRVVADHLRSTAFLIADGVLPSNEGRGYVLRRIMRRAMRHAHMMGAREPVMYRLVPALGAADGRRLSRAGARRGADRRDAAAGGDPLPADAGARPASAGRGDGAAGRPPAAAGRGRVPAVRHVRLPARPDAGRAARAGPRGRPRRLRGGDGRAARARPRRLGRAPARRPPSACGSS